MYDIYFDLEDMHQTVDEEIHNARNDQDSWAFDQLDFDFVKDLPTKPNDMDGCVCKSCKEFCPYAEPNQPDGSMICYSCRKYR